MTYFSNEKLIIDSEFKLANANYQSLNPKLPTCLLSGPPCYYGL